MKLNFGDPKDTIRVKSYEMTSNEVLEPERHKAPFDSCFEATKSSEFMWIHNCAFKND